MRPTIHSCEHFSGNISNTDLPDGQFEFKIPFPKKKRLNSQEYNCVHLFKSEDGLNLNLSYFIGLDWIVEDQQAIYVAPKLNGNDRRTDYVKMLLKVLENSDTAIHVDELYNIKFHSSNIEIEQENDLLTPLLIVHFLGLVKKIVRNGLKKSYYRVSKTLNGRIKGKLEVGRTIRQGILKNKPLKNQCSYDEYGLDHFENRLIKKALTFARGYINNHTGLSTKMSVLEMFDYIFPAFENVSDAAEATEFRTIKSSVFYKEYENATRLAKYILQRFGYNITAVSGSDKIPTPPFWIDMSKLFELYVLSYLKQTYRNEILYGTETQGNYGMPDYLLIKKDHELILDAKYKPRYNESSYRIEDIRQLSGYARDKQVLACLRLSEQQVVDCLIIYPEYLSDPSENAAIELDLENKSAISEFVNFYKISIKLPVQ
ncbi:MAG: McrC family protein [Bacteroidia bacterium]|nr:McrC family protein [Bacteroidia bacterium]